MQDFKILILFTLLFLWAHDCYHQEPEPPEVKQGTIHAFNRFDLIQLIRINTTSYCDVLNTTRYTRRVSISEHGKIDDLHCMLEIGYTFQVAKIEADQSILWVVNGGTNTDECKQDYEIQVQNDFLTFRELIQ